MTKHQFGGTVVVVGAGMGGLCAAAAVSGYFDEVVVVERDELPAEPQFRVGVPQGAHVHTFLGFAVEAIESLLPGIMDDLYAAGAVKIRRNFDVWFHDSYGPTPRRDVGILTPSVTRPLLEHIVRKRVTGLGNVRLVTGARVKTYLSDSNGKVTGLSIKFRGGSNEELSSDLVIDCAGRGSCLPRWLEEQGYGEIPAQTIEIDMGYTSGLFEPPEDLANETWACLMLAVPPGLRASYLTPVDGGLWLATMYGRAGDFAPREHIGFVEWTKGLAHPCIHERLVQAKPVGQLRSFKIPKGVWRRFDKMERFPDAILPLGEVFTAFNPMYGQGISLAASQAQAISKAFAKIDNPSTGVELRQEYFDGCFEINQTGWSVMETRDFAYSSTKGSRPLDIEKKWRLAEIIRDLAETNVEVHELSVRVTHLLEPPVSLINHPEVAKVLENTPLQ
jgi:2-polyprenyl-6-methoxyphenol hydroxylase-like FAD-dependent oxidoreductase